MLNLLGFRTTSESTAAAQNLPRLSRRYCNLLEIASNCVEPTRLSDSASWAIPVQCGRNETAMTIVYVSSSVARATLT